MKILNENNKDFFKFKEGNYIYLKDDNWYEKEFEKMMNILLGFLILKRK